jgi:hypothetical protein
MFEGPVLIYSNSSLVFPSLGLLLGKHFGAASIVLGYGLYLKARFYLTHFIMGRPDFGLYLS